jgi:hypothetical protein
VHRVAVFHLSQFQASAFANANALFYATAAIHRNEVLALNFASRREVVGNNFVLARSNS